METNKPGQGRELNEQNQQSEERTGTNQPSRQNTSTAPLQEEREEDALTERADEDLDEQSENLRG
ncbi:MAG: hypothetical protein BGO69_01520 [Bacteroidetes bacterium 46-16]|nr:MAG: hypothetical protein BGO69_01520 [Bacteroidetes bacterium 46-16]